MPKTKKRGRAGKGEKECPLLTVQGILRLDKTFVPPKHEDADTLLIQRQPHGPVEAIKLIPGQSEHEMVEYKAGYDVGPSNPFPQNQAEQKLFEERQEVERVQAAFAELQKQSLDERQAREAQFKREEVNRQRASRGLPPISQDEAIDVELVSSDPGHPKNYFPPSEALLPPGDENATEIETAKIGEKEAPKTVTESELPGEETQNLPEERLPQLRPMPIHTGDDEPEMGVRDMALQVALALEEERKKAAAQASQDDENVIYSLDELTAMKQKRVQGPEMTVESVVQRRTEENNKAVLDAYWQFVRENPQDFNGWTYLLQHVENMGDLDEVRSAYNAFLPLYPYCFAYWERYCDIEKRSEHWERALAILHRGLEAIPMSVDLWLAYLELYRKMYEKLDNFDELFRSQWEKAVMTVGLEYRSDPLWESIIEWETARNNLKEVTHIYKRLISVPTKLYNKHWDNFIAHVRDHHPRDILYYEEYEALRQVTCDELNLKYRPDPIIEPVKPREVIQPEDKLKAGMKERIVASVVSEHEWVEEAVDKRYRFEEKIKRPYFHVKAMDLKQLKNWDAYLDFEILEGNHERIVVLFERCLIPCAQYEQFWEKYAAYMEKYYKSRETTRTKNAHSVQDNAKSVLTKAKWAFGTGLETVQQIRDKRCTWTLRGWMEFDDEGHAVMKASEISEKDKEEEKKKMAKEDDKNKTTNTTEQQTTQDASKPSECESAQDMINNEMSLVLKTSWDNQGRQAVRDIYKRACIVHCRKKALIKMKWAAFEEETGDSLKAREILLELNQRYPLLLECWFQIIDIDRRLGEFDKAEEHYKVLMSKIPMNRRNIKTWVAMKLARFQFKVCGSAEKALSTLRLALKKEKGEPTLYSQIIDVCYQRHPVDVKGVTAAIELAIKSNELTNMQKLGFVKRKLEFMQEFGDIRRLREAQDQLKQFRKLCANDLKLEQKRRKELEKEQVKLEELEKFRAQTRADVNLKAKIAEAEGRLLCTGCHTAMYPDEQGVYEFEKPRNRIGDQSSLQSSNSADNNTNAAADDGVIDLMDMVISSEQEEHIKKTLEEKTKYKEVAPTWELNIETYGYGRKRKTYDPDYEHIESAKFKEYERLETTGYDESIKDEDRDKLKRISAPGLGLDAKAKKARTPSAEPLTTSDYIVPPKVPQLMLGPGIGPRKPESAPGSEKEEEISAFELPPEIADPQKSPCVNVPEWFVKEGGELCLSDTGNGMSVIRYWPKFLSDKGNHLMFNRLRRYCKWHQKQRQIGGEWKYETRLVAWYGPCDYVHSGLKLEKNLNWAPELLDLLHRLIAMTKHEFNACFLNLYRHGHDMCGWHSDTHPQLGRNPPVASVSLGGVRVFELRKKTGAPNFIRFPLFPGSLLVMEGATQEDWLHCLPRDPNCAQERINLTFRTMYSIDKRN